MAGRSRGKLHAYIGNQGSEIGFDGSGCNKPMDGSLEIPDKAQVLDPVNPWVAYFFQGRNERDDIG